LVSHAGNEFKLVASGVYRQLENTPIFLTGTNIAVLPIGSVMTLQDKLDKQRAKLESQLPQETRAAMHQAIGDLIASNQALHAIQAGDWAPAFALPDSEGNLVSSLDLLKDGPLVVTFFRGRWCTSCNLELRALQDALEDYRLRDATLLAISQQTSLNSQSTRRENYLTYPILQDKDGEVAASFGLRWKIPEDLQRVHQQIGADLAVFNGEASWTLPMPARYVIGQDGVVAYAEINPDFTQRPEPDDVLPVLDAFKAAYASS
jgi:peroxiredoxin